MNPLRSALRCAVVCFVLCLARIWAPAGAGCFSIVVGQEASVSGSVLIAHNEDDGPPVVVNHHKIPRRTWPPGSQLRMWDGARLEQVPETWAYIWSEIPGLSFSDSYLNEWGVCVTSDNCPSREDDPELEQGGIRKMLRRLVAERARSAREGVRLAGRLIERFGYGASGRTYVICDPREGWLLCAVHGKHWVAARVPGDQVAMVANTMTLGAIDLADTSRFLGSADIVDYAQERGWYDPASEGSFDVAAAYADPQSAENPLNLERQWSGLRRVLAAPPRRDQRLPWSVVPRHKLSVADLMAVLRDHHEGTVLEVGGDHPHAGGRTICNSTTQTSFVAELREGLPTDLGLVYWVCLGPPCTSCYVPFHFGIQGFPDGYALKGGGEAYRTFTNLHAHVSDDYGARIDALRGVVRRIESAALAEHAEGAEELRLLYARDAGAARVLLTQRGRDRYREAITALTTLGGGEK